MTDYVETDAQLEARLAREVEWCSGVLTQPGATDTVEVQVSWVEAGGTQRAAHYLVNVNCEAPGDFDGDPLDYHPCTLATQLVRSQLSSLASTRGWQEYDVTDCLSA